MKNKMNIFIIEDNPVFAKTLKYSIENNMKNKFNLYLYETGEEAMQNFKKLKPKIVILDYHLTMKHSDAIDGIKVLNLIKKENKETIVIILTKDDHLDIAISSFKCGAYDYIVKTDTLFIKINNLLFNLFNTITNKRDTKIYKYSLAVFMSAIILLSTIFYFI